MLEQLSQENVDEYASNALTIDQPTGTDWTQGVKVGKTIPAKWWNWLFNAVTKRLGQAKADSQEMLTELKNTVTDAGITIDPTDNTQLSHAAQALAVTGVNSYVQDKKRGFFAKWTSESCTGIPVFSSEDNITIETLKAIPNSDSNAFYMCIRKHTSNPAADYWYHYTSTDLLNWHEITAPAGAELQTADIVYFKGRYYFLYSVKDVYSAQLYYSDDAASWYLARSFTEYGTLGLRVASGILWMISASAQTYSNINYHSFRTTDGSTWTDAGEIFRNSASVEDKVSNVTPFKGGYIIGNKVTTDGLTWSAIVTDWANSAFSKVFILADGTAVIQYNSTEGAWYTLSAIGASPVKKLGTWVLMMSGPGNRILAKDASDDYAGLTSDGDTFTKLSILYPVQAGAEFFKIDETYVLGNYKSADLETWEAIALPTGATVVQYAGIGYYIIAGNYFSKDAGENWEEGTCIGVAFCTVPVYITSTATCMTVYAADGVIQRRLTFNGVNRVIGTTLYLK